MFHNLARTSLWSLSLIALICALPKTNAWAATEEASYYNIRIEDLEFTEGKPPAPSPNVNLPRRERRKMAPRPYVVLDRNEEAYLHCQRSWGTWSTGRRRGVCISNLTLRVKAPHKQDITGSYYALSSDDSHLVKVPFRLSASKANPESKSDFQTARKTYYDELLGKQIAGAAWFRAQIDRDPSSPPPVRRTWRRNTLDGTYEMFTGGRAISENLQLDRELPFRDRKKRTVDVSTIEGITIQEIDWKPLLEGRNPKIDSLAHYVPADQYALFFKNFENLIHLIDNSSQTSLPVFDVFEARSEDARSRERYEAQLLLRLDEFTRQLGPKVIQKVSITGSDPYIRTGTDLALIFQTEQPAILQTYLSSLYLQASQSSPKLKVENGQVHGVPYTFIRSADRAISSYTATLDNVVVVSNSSGQLGKIISTHQDKMQSAGDLDEFKFFRDRYSLDDSTETALLFVSDAAIRKWCGPKWRIAASRRIQAAAVMGDLQARLMDGFVSGTPDSAKLDELIRKHKIDEFYLSEQGPASKLYGNPAFLTPISELAIDKVTNEEAQAYRRFRESYQRRWARFFDPIAVRFEFNQSKVGIDMSIMPLIQNSDYRSMLDFTGGQVIPLDAPQPSNDDIFRFSLAPRKDSRVFGQATGMLAMATPGLANPLGWFGDYLSLNLKTSPFWNEVQSADNPGNFVENNYTRVPVGLSIGVQDSLRLTMFLTGLRGMVTQSAPGLTTWENLTHAEVTYVRVTSTRNPTSTRPGSSWSVYYAVFPDMLYVSLDEKMVKHMIDSRQHAKTSTDNSSAAKKHIDVAIRRPFLDLVGALFEDSYQERRRQSCWNNLPILNVWKRRYPDRDPLELHEKHWKTRLRCTSGGSYVWNEEWQTMESTVYGHPGQPKLEPQLDADPLEIYRRARFGLSFVQDGLRAKVALTKKKPLMEGVEAAAAQASETSPSKSQ